MNSPALHMSGLAAIGGTRIFGPVTIEAPAGAWTCLLGPSGVGKSTLLRLFAGLSDDVDFEGTIGAGYGRALTGRVALMAQDDLLVPWLDVLGNVTLGARLRGVAPDLARARDVLDRVGLSRHAQKRPQALSGGQRQRAALARTLIEDRPVVLLDEPFSALDAKTRAEMQALAAELLTGRTVLHVTHDVAEAARTGHRVLLMSATGIEALPPPPALPLRAFDAPHTLEFQGRLLRRMMETA